MITSEITSSSFINREKTRDLKLEDILPQSQLPSNKKIDVLAKAVNNIILNNGNDYNLTPDQKKLHQKTNTKINATYFKKKLEDRFVEYTNPEYSSSTLKEANLVYRQQRHREVKIMNETRRRNAPDGPFHPLKFADKDETNLRNIPEKNILMGTLMLTIKEILLCYEAPIKNICLEKR